MNREAAQYRLEKIAHCREMIAIWRTCLKKIAEGGQAYGADGKSLTRADLDKVRKALADEEAALQALLSIGQRRVRRVVPIDD